MFPTLPLVALAGLTFHLATGSPLPPSSSSSVYPQLSTTSVNALVRRQYNEEDFNDLFEYDWPLDVISSGYDAEPPYKQMLGWPGPPAWDQLSATPNTFIPFRDFMMAWKGSSPFTLWAPFQGPPPDEAASMAAAAVGVGGADDDDAATSGHFVTIPAEKVQDAMAKLLADPKAKAWLVERLLARGDDESVEQLLSSQAV
ncbi:hypothetical protein D6D13_02937 [Aureobasidium pullulans]|uniref:Uncharacterized protein n=1 Tax=Aureobasidium pullulans TaxID=5580 RepID=A0A4S9D3N9_AURPU|nr:hypothetical protein D6D13_02937 [Aureobasidium pullulans]